MNCHDVVVFLNTSSVAQHQPKVILSSVIALICGKPEKTNCFFVILSHTCAASHIDAAQSALSPRIAPTRRSHPEDKRLFFVLPDAQSTLISKGQLTLSSGISAFCFGSQLQHFLGHFSPPNRAGFFCPDTHPSRHRIHQRGKVGIIERAVPIPQLVSLSHSW